MAIFDREPESKANAPSSLEAREQNLRLKQEKEILKQELFEAQSIAERLQKSLSRLRFDFERSKGDGLMIQKLTAEQQRFATRTLLVFVF